MDRLAKKAKLAKDLGVSYGQLMVMVEAGKITIDLPVKKNPEPALNGRKCVECDKPLVRQQRRFCSDVCREKAQKQKAYANRGKKENGLHCLNCGMALVAHQTRFCSPGCQQHRRKYKEIAIPCKFCGKPVTGKRKYCSDKCRDMGNGFPRRGGMINDQTMAKQFRVQ